MQVYIQLASQISINGTDKDGLNATELRKGSTIELKTEPSLGRLYQLKRDQDGHELPREAPSLSEGDTTSTGGPEDLDGVHLWYESNAFTKEETDGKVRHPLLKSSLWPSPQPPSSTRNIGASSRGCPSARWQEVIATDSFEFWLLDASGRKSANFAT